MNAERFEERLMHELKNHVQQRAHSPHPESAPVSRPRRRLGVRLALPAGVAATAAGIALTVLPAQTAAAYTLEHASSDLVKLTIVNPAGKVNLDQLHKDLDRLGVPNLLLLGDPRCSTPPDSDSSTAATSPGPANAPQAAEVGRENGKTVLYVHPAKIPAHATLMVGFPLAKTDPAHGYAVIESGLITGHAPTCLPAAHAGAVLSAPDPSHG